MSFLIPKPQNWEALEDLAADVFARRFRNHNFQRFGRTGQRQGGVDIAGPLPSGEVVGVQCKHHPRGDISKTEIDEEIEKSKQFSPTLTEYYIVTSADRDVKLGGHVLRTSRARVKAGTYPVYILFWEGICEWLAEYPDLVYKHFTRHFPTHELEQVSLNGLIVPKAVTLTWPVTADELQASAARNLANVRQVDPYNLTVGLTTFADFSFGNRVDLVVSLAEHYGEGSESSAAFAEAARILKEVRGAVAPPAYSKQLTVHLQTRLTVAYLFGWLFRRVPGYELMLVHRNEVWKTSDLPAVTTGLVDDLPCFLNQASDEVVVVLSISRDIRSSVLNAVEQWPSPPRVVMSYYLDQLSVRNAAHALSLSLEIAHRLKHIQDRWNVGHIHLYSALPAALAAMISHNLNAIVCPISLYYLGDDRRTYMVGGTLQHNL